MIGWIEVAVIAIALLLLFGGRQLPGLAQGVGRAIRNFKHALRGDDGITVRRARASEDDEKTGQSPADGG